MGDVQVRSHKSMRKGNQSVVITMVRLHIHARVHSDLKQEETSRFLGWAVLT